MLKEIILAIVVGALLGVGVMGGYLSLDKKNNSQNENITTITPTSIIESTIVDNTKINNPLSINYFEDNDIVSESNLEISGNTSPNSTVIVTLGDQILDDQSDENGDFTFELELESGLNIIKTTSIDSQDNQTEKILHITYSTAKI